MNPTLPISVILATTEPWPDLAECLKVLGPQVAALGGEIVVGDGHGEALDVATEVGFPWLRCIRMPGASVFELRGRLMEAARGDVVAITEDHCIVGADWCEQVLSGFKEHPEAVALYGPVLNGSPNRRMDWANFLHSFGYFLPGSDPNQRERTPPVANVAFRRSVLEGQTFPVGRLELEFLPSLFRANRLQLHEPMMVHHVQSHGLFGTFLAHFDNGRSTTGLGRASFSEDRLPWNLYQTTIAGFPKSGKFLEEQQAAKPLLFLMSCCHSLGEIVGIVAGPGRSPERLR